MQSTTIIAVRRDGQVAVACDGQVTLQNTIVKSTARKIHRLADDKVLVGFAGSAADSLALLERFEAKMKEHRSGTLAAARQLARDWRSDRILRRLEALMIVADLEHSLLLSGSGDLISPDDGIIGIGSGGAYATAAARALTRHTDQDPEAVVRHALTIAGELCVYTNTNITVLSL